MSARGFRVLLLSQAPQRRGAEVAAFELGAALLRAGCVVRRLYLYSHAGAAALPLEEGDRVLEGEPAHLCERVPGIHPGVLRRLRQEIAAFAPEVVQANGGRTVKYAAAARRLDGAAGWALVYRNIGDPRRWSRGIRGWAYRQLVMPQVDGVLGVSATTLAAARSHYGFDGVPAKTIQGGVDPAVLAPRRAAVEVRTSLSTSLEAPVLLFVGNFSAEKRVDRVLDWTSGARREHPNLRLWLVGDGPLRSKLEGQARALGLAENVVFTGRQEHVGDYLAAADVLLLASDTEGIPGVILEAGALGVPTVATAVGGVAECIEDGVSGFLVPPEDEATAIAAICALLASPNLRRALGDSARCRVEAHHHIDSIAARYLDFYREVLARRRSVEPA